MHFKLYIFKTKNEGRQEKLHCLTCFCTSTAWRILCCCDRLLWKIVRLSKLHGTWSSHVHGRKSWFAVSFMLTRLASCQRSGREIQRRLFCGDFLLFEKMIVWPVMRTSMALIGAVTWQSIQTGKNTHLDNYKVQVPQHYIQKFSKKGKWRKKEIKFDFMNKSVGFGCLQILLKRVQMLFSPHQS